VGLNCCGCEGEDFAPVGLGLKGAGAGGRAREGLEDAVGEHDFDGAYGAGEVSVMDAGAVGGGRDAAADEICGSEGRLWTAKTRLSMQDANWP